MFTVRKFFPVRDVEDTSNPTHLMACWESNLIQPCFLCKQVVYLHVYNPLGGGVACKYILYTGIRNLAGREFKVSFLSILPIVVHDMYYYSQYLFIYPFFIYIYISFFLFFFFMINKIYGVREHFAILIFNKYLVLEFWLG